MNCSKCKYLQTITKNSKARCLIHGITVLLNRFEKRKLTGLPVRTK